MKQSAVAVPLAVPALALLALAPGCDQLADLADQLADAVIPVEPQAAPPSEPEVEDVDTELPERPATSTARSETDVISFRSILENKQMTRRERIRAFENLDPAALQKPVARSNVSAGPQGQGTERGAGNREPADWEIATARRRVPVVMYATAWCGVCKRARKYFEENRIAFEEHDVDQDPVARAEYERLNPRRSVPTIKIADEVVVGFSAVAVERALDAAARARLN
ncbi:MAG: glutaredoxin family protein [Myxococcales bacterium]|nr:glutaredoxin family protein [Myxococcales bacterium]